MVLTEEKNHDLEGFANEIDSAVRHYLGNMFDVFVHEDKLDRISITDLIPTESDLQSYVAVEEASLEGDLEIIVNKLRKGEQVYGMDRYGNPVPTKGKGNSIFPDKPRVVAELTTGWKGTPKEPASPWQQSYSPARQANPGSRSYQAGLAESNNARLKSKYDL